MKYAIGRKVEMLREFVGLTQTQLSVLLGKDQSYISKVERSKIENPSVEQLIAIANVCEMHPSYFLTDHLPHRYYDFTENLKTAFYLKALPDDVRMYFTEAISHLYDFDAILRKKLEDEIPVARQKPSILKPFNEEYFRKIEENRWNTSEESNNLVVNRS